MDCCTSTTDLGCFTCGPITTTVLADQDGTWKVRRKYRGTVKETEISGANGAALSIPSGTLGYGTNEFWFVRPDATVLGCYAIEVLPTAPTGELYKNLDDIFCATADCNTETVCTD